MTKYNRKVERKESFVFDSGEVREMIERQESIERKLDHITGLLLSLDKFIHYPDWLTRDQAMEILPFKDARTLRKWVQRGVISSRCINRHGTNLVYSKKDCIEFPELAHRWLDRNP